MIKISDACEFVQKKINRNNVLMEIFKLSENILEKEIYLKNDIKKFYHEQIANVKIINNIEVLQMAEYTEQRQDEINYHMKNIGTYKISDKIQIIMKEISDIKNDIKFKSDLIQSIQTEIPKSGTATNYKLYTYDPNETCGNATRNV
jgi:hypothetical protein